MTDLIASLPRELAIEMVLLFAGATVLAILAQVVRTTLDDDLPIPHIGWLSTVIFGVILPGAIVIWFLTIVVRYLLGAF